MNEKKLRWGCLGAGVILDRFLPGAFQDESAEFVAVASRTRETAEKMAAKWRIPRTMTYEEMLASPEIDAVYIPVPHPFHRELAARAAEAGKHILVEKPACVSAEEWRQLSALAREKGVFLMEAVWTRFFPAIAFVKEQLAKGMIGAVRAVQSSFAFRIEERGRLTEPEMAGGSLLDVGVYDLHFARMILDKDPVQLKGVAGFDTDGLHLKVDEHAAITALYDRGEIAVMTCAVRTRMPDTAYIYGETGYFELPHFWSADTVKLVKGDRMETFSFPVPQKDPARPDEGYQFEFRHANECIRKGLTESPVLPHSVTESILTQCDSLRRDWGEVYPFEKK